MQTEGEECAKAWRPKTVWNVQVVRVLVGQEIELEMQSQNPM